jgi:hypothetical protein
VLIEVILLSGLCSLLSLGWTSLGWTYRLLLLFILLCCEGVSLIGDDSIINQKVFQAPKFECSDQNPDAEKFHVGLI